MNDNLRIWNIWRSQGDLYRRTVVLIAKYAVALATNPNATAAQKSWAISTLSGDGAEREADVIRWMVACNGTVMQNGDAISDSDLDWVVQTAVNTLRLGGG